MTDNRTKVWYNAGGLADDKRRYGFIDGYIHAPSLHNDDPNIWAIVIDANTGTLCAVRLYDCNVIHPRAVVKDMPIQEPGT